MATWHSCLEQAAPGSGESMFGEHKDSEEGRDPGPSPGEPPWGMLMSGNATGKKTCVFGPI